VKTRLEVTQKPTTQANLAAAIEKSNALQEKLWRRALELAATDSGMVPTGLFIQSLNEMIDDQAKRLAAIRNRVPNVVQLALLGIALA
jgi:hypothetical protein